jgi:hypothetical protein
MARSRLLLILTALAFGWITEAQAQDISDEDLARCEVLLATLEPGAAATPEQERCLALLAELGVQPAQGFDLQDSTAQDPTVLS